MHYEALQHAAHERSASLAREARVERLAREARGRRVRRRGFRLVTAGLPLPFGHRHDGARPPLSA